MYLSQVHGSQTWKLQCLGPTSKSRLGRRQMHWTSHKNVNKTTRWEHSRIKVWTSHNKPSVWSIYGDYSTENWHYHWGISWQPLLYVFWHLHVHFKGCQFRWRWNGILSFDLKANFECHLRSIKVKLWVISTLPIMTEVCLLVFTLQRRLIQMRMDDILNFNLKAHFQGHLRSIVVK